MKLTLKSLKIVKEFSRETTCFSASLYADDKKVADVRNDGHGGCNLYRWVSPQAAERVVAWANAQKMDCDFEKLDQLVDREITRVDLAKTLTRWCRTTLIFRLKGDKADSWRTVKPQKGHTLAGSRQFVVKKYGEQVAVIANDDIALAVEATLEADRAENAARAAATAATAGRGK